MSFYVHVPLHDRNHLLLETQLPITLIVDPSSAHGLNVEEDGLDRLLAHLLHDAHGSRPEEHLGVAEPDKKVNQ